MQVDKRVRGARHNGSPKRPLHGKHLFNDEQACNGIHPANGERSIAADLSNLKILRDRFVFDVHSGAFHRISEPAAYILGKLKEQTSVDEIVMRYEDRYGIPRAVAKRDVELFLNDLVVAGLPAVSSAGA